MNGWKDDCFIIQSSCIDGCVFSQVVMMGQAFDVESIIGRKVIAGEAQRRGEIKEKKNV